MRTPAELGSSLLECMREVSSLLERAVAIAEDERDALVKSDAQNITLCYKAQEEILRRIGEVDQRAASMATALAQLAGMDPDTADTNALAKAAGSPYDELIGFEINKISLLAKQIKQAGEINKKLLSNGIDIIANCLRTLATPHKPPVYERDACMISAESYILSVDRRA